MTAENKEWKCLNCDTSQWVYDKHATTHIECPHCGYKNRIPKEYHKERIKDNKKEFASKMKEIFSTECSPYDYEEQHRDADKLMCEILKKLGYNEGVEVFEKAKKYYS